ncbi:MAG: hypothetical protein GF341_01385 [candidate division Zixibacteria bacterium]|nr:hypothetical protein [candidate division Zixibacteria bacterium]
MAGHLKLLPIVGVGLAAVIIACLSMSELSAVSSSDRVQTLGGGRYLVAEAQTVGTDGLNGIRLTGPPNLGGQVIINAESTDSVMIEINKILRVGSAQIAEELDKEIELLIRPVGSVLGIDVQTPRGARWEGTDWGVRLELILTVPKGWNLDFDTRHFEFDLNGPFQDVSIRTEFGRVNVADVSRQVDIRGNYTGIELEDVRGRISARTAYSDLTVRHAIPAADEPLELMNSFGPIVVNELVGALLIETESAPITLKEISLVGATSRVYGDNSSVQMTVNEFGRARLEIKTSHSPIKLVVPEYLSARLSLAVGSGGVIHTEGLPIQTHRNLLSQHRVEGVCGAGDGLIDINGAGAATIELVGR